MKLVISESDNQLLNELKERLMQNGIPAFIQGEDTGRMIPLAFFRASLWIYVDSQYKEAIALINDPDYVVKNQVDVELAIQSHSHDLESGESKRAYTELGLFIAKLFIAMIILIGLLKWLQT